MKITTKVMFLYAAACFLILVIMGKCVGDKSEKQMQATIYNNYQKQLMHIDFAMTNYFENMESDLELLARIDSIATADDGSYTDYIVTDRIIKKDIGLNEKLIRSIFDDYKQTHEYVDNIFAAYETGSYISSRAINIPIGYDPRRAEWYKKSGQFSGRIVKTSPYFSELDNGIHIIVSKALFDENRRFIGVVGIDLILSALTEYISETQLHHDDDGWMNLIDEKGKVILSGDKGMQLKNLQDVDSDFYDKLFVSKKGFTELEYRGDRIYAYFYTSPLLGWKLVANVKAKIIINESRSFVFNILFMLFVSLLLLTMFTFFGMKRFILHPVMDLAEGADLIAQTGDLNHRIDVKTEDEIGVVGSSFNTMIENIMEKEEELLKHRDHLEELVEERAAELKASEKKYRTLFSGAPIGIFTSSVAGDCFVNVNPELARLFGYDSAEDILESVTSLSRQIYADPEDRDRFLKKLSAEKQLKNWESMYLKKDGSIFWVSMNVRIVTDKNDQLTIEGFVFDITDRKIMEDRVKRYEFIANASDELMSLINTDYVYEAVNDAYCSAIDKKREQILGKSVLDLWGEEQFKVIKVSLDSCLAGQHITFNGWIEFGKLGKRYMSVKYSPYHDENGNITHATVLSIDVTENKEMEEQIEQNRNLLSSLINAIPDLIFYKDIDGKYLGCNESFMKMVGKSERQILNKTDSQLFGKRRAAARRNSDIKVLGTLIPHHSEEWHYYSDGRGVLFDTLKTPFFNDEGNLLGLVSISRDITDRKEMEEALTHAKEDAEAATTAKSHFLANMSHEIRTPMNAIIGLSHLMEKTKTDVRQKDYLTKIQNASYNLLKIINDILDFSKIEAGKLDVEFIDFNLNEVMENLSNVVSIKAQDKGLELIIKINRDVPLDLIGDPLRLGQILLNLTNNAIKFTENGEICLICETLESGKKSAEQTITLKFSVRDTGIGLTKEQKDGLFRAFTQADASTTRKYGGTGLGLSISKRLAEMMGGTIGVESEHNEGSTFYFTVVFKIPDEKKLKKKTLPKELHNLNVLVVDDNETARDTFVEYLEAFSFNPAAADSGEEAIRELERVSLDKEKKYDVILVDWKMPGLNGINTCKKILADKQIKEKPKIIMVTGYGREEVIMQSEELGLDGFLLKPVSQSMLYDSIMQVFGKEIDAEQPVSDKKKALEKEMDKIRGAKILLVEDNVINQQVAIELLEHEGFVTALAGNGKEALAIIEDDRDDEIDLILMDLQMHVMDGYEAAKEIRLTNGELPILAMSADAMSGVKKKVFNAGMNDYISKPIDVEQLFTKLIQWIPAGKKRTKIIKAKKQETYTVDFSALKSLDVKEGLGRISGNEELYKNLLVSFKEKNENVIIEIEKALEKNNREQAEHIAHALKGVAGNISAKKLFKSVVTLDRELKKENYNKEKTAGYLENIKPILYTVIEEIKKFEKSALELKISPKKGDAPLNANAIKPVLKQLKQNLLDYSTEAVRSYEKLKDMVVNTGSENLNILEKNIRNYDFDKALEELEKFISQIKGHK